MSRSAQLVVLGLMVVAVAVVGSLNERIDRLERRAPPPATSTATTLVETCNETRTFRIVTNGVAIAMAPDPGCARETP